MKLNITSIKLIALICMITSHFGIVFSYPVFESIRISHNVEHFLIFIGKMGLPLFAFSIANGWKHTKSKADYFMRMVIFACISQIPYIMAFYIINFEAPTKGNNFTCYLLTSIWVLAVVLLLILIFCRYSLGFSYKNSIVVLFTILIANIFLDINGFRYLCDKLNIFYTFIVSIFMMYCFDKIKINSQKWYKQAFMITIFVLSFLFIQNCSDSIATNFTIGLVFLLYLTYKHRWIQSLIIALWGILLYGFMFHNIYNMFLACLPVIISAVIILFYDESIVPPKARWFYWAYPVHLLILGLVNLFRFH